MTWLKSGVKVPTRPITVLSARKSWEVRPLAASHSLQIEPLIILLHGRTLPIKILPTTAISVIMSANGEDTFMDDAQGSQAGETEQLEELEENKLFLVWRAS